MGDLIVQYSRFSSAWAMAAWAAATAASAWAMPLFWLTSVVFRDALRDSSSARAASRFAAALS
jgi:hypothetical protein